MARSLKSIRSLVVALTFALTVIAAVNAQPTGFPPTNSQPGHGNSVSSVI